MSKTIPIIRKTALLNKWVIITRYTQKKGHILAHIKYPIPKKDIEYIANDWLISQLKDLGYEKGYSYTTGSEEEGTLIKVTVERISEKKDSEETVTISGVEVLKDNDIFTVSD